MVGVDLDIAVMIHLCRHYGWSETRIDYYVQLHTKTRARRPDGTSDLSFWRKQIGMWERPA